MKRSESLSVVVPFQNDQANVVAAIETLLDYISDLAQDVQIVAVDDCTTDATAELLEETRRLLPQIDVLRLAKPLGAMAAANKGLDLVRGDFVFIQESYAVVDLDTLNQLWQLRQDEQLVMVRAQVYRNEIDVDLVAKLTQYAEGFERHFNEQKTSADGNHDSRAMHHRIEGAQASQRRDELKSRQPDGQLQMLRRDAMQAMVKQPQVNKLQVKRELHSRFTPKNTELI